MKKPTFKDYLESAFFAYMHENSICPLTHDGIEFYFGKIYERRIDRKEWSTYFVVRDDLNFIVDEAKEMQANGLKLCWNKGIPFVDPYQD